MGLSFGLLLALFTLSYMLVYLPQTDKPICCTLSYIPGRRIQCCDAFFAMFTGCLLCGTYNPEFLVARAVTELKINHGEFRDVTIPAETSYAVNGFEPDR